MALDERGGVAIDGHGFDDIRVQRALSEELGFADFAGRFLENVDEGVADDLAFSFGVSDALEFAQK